MILNNRLNILNVTTKLKEEKEQNLKASSKVSTDSKKNSTKTSLSSTTSKTDLTKGAEAKKPLKSKKISEVKKSKDDHLDEIPQIEEPSVAKTSKINYWTKGFGHCKQCKYLTKYKQ